MTNVLLKTGAKAPEKYVLNHKTLMIAVNNKFTQRNLKKIKALIEDVGSNIDNVDYFGNTALFYSMKSNNLDVIKLLIQSRAVVRTKNYNGYTPLMKAI